MALSDLSDPKAVEAALEEFDRIGRSAFLAAYDSGPARGYFVVRAGKRYDSKAVVAAAHGYQFGEVLHPADFVGGAATVAPKLRALGFEVIGPSTPIPPRLEPGRTYSWEELGQLFDFRPDYLGAAGGMVSRPELGVLLLMTHPGGARSIDYGDYWDGDDLIYTGRGKVGDQERSGQNRDVGDNAKTLLVFEPDGSRRLLCRGEATCIQEWTTTAPGADGNPRRVLRFRLRFDPTSNEPRENRPNRRGSLESPRAVERRPRSFDPNRPPAKWIGTGRRRDPEETLVLQEKAARNHHRLLADLANWLSQNGWTAIEEIPAAIDLMAARPNARRVIFEAKTGAARAEVQRTRAAVSQLLEYRFFYGRAADVLCLVTDAPISDKRCRLLDELGVAVIWLEEGRFAAGSRTAADLFGGYFGCSPDTDR